MEALHKLVRQIERTEDLDAAAGPVASWVKKQTRPTAVKNALSGTWLGHPLHPLLTDVPIGAWVMASALDLFGGKKGARSARRLVSLGVLAAVPTAAAGLSDWSDTYGPDQRVGLVHGAGVTAATVVQAMSCVARRRGHRFIGMVLSALGLGVVTGSAYLGGHLSFNKGIGVSHTAFQEPTTEWTDVAPLADLAEDTPTRVDAKGVPVVLVRQHDQVYALSATCVHAGGPLDEGTLENGTLTCPWHNSIFRISDGKALRGPAAISQPVWDVRVEDGRIEVRGSDD